MGCLQALELKVDDENDIEQLFSNTSHLKEFLMVGHLLETYLCIGKKKGLDHQIVM